MKNFFPTVPVLPVLGNHESVPVDSFPPPSLEHHGASMDWLYSTLAEVWEEWLGENVRTVVEVLALNIRIRAYNENLSLIYRQLLNNFRTQLICFIFIYFAKFLLVLVTILS